MKHPFRPFTKLFRYNRPGRPLQVPPADGPEAPAPEDSLSPRIQDSLRAMNAVFHHPKNADYVVRELLLGERRCAVLHIDGMTSRTDLEDFVLRPMQQAAPLTAKGEALAQELLDRVLPTGTGKTETDPRKIAQFILGGNFAVLLDGCPEAVLCEMQGFSRRGVEQPVTETVIMGPHQAFNENMRTNLSLLRRILKTPDLVDELFYVGKKAQNPLAICYMESIANPALVEEVKRRVQGIESDVVYTSGELAQLIEDKTFALLPQLLLTERPDRAASFLMDGMVLLVYDNSPYAVAAPATLAAFLHSGEDTSLRWQYGLFIRLIRTLGMLVALFLPAVYNALLLYHQELLPAELLTSLLEGHAMVPFSVTAELLLMEFTFNLINEASLRMPGHMGSTLGIIGALVLGQAAVSANLISPALIIIVSIAGLGTFALPNYPMSIALRIRRICYILASSFFGFTGIAALVTLFLFCDCALESFGVPYFAPFAPKMPHNPDLFLRLPLYMQRMTPPMFRPKQRVRSTAPRGWDPQEGKLP